MSRFVHIPFGRVAHLSGVASWRRLRRQVRSWLRMLGWPGMVAIGIMAAFPPFYLSVIAEAQERLESVRHSTLALRQQNAADGAAGETGGTPVDQLAAFYRMFPAERDTPQRLKQLAALAEKNGLSLDEGEFEVVQAPGGRLLRLRMVLPVKGEYPRIRGFLAALPAEIPGIALENVQFSRQNVTDPAVAAQIRLALYLEQAS
ncbi:MAG TPA: GspMb/PilO family protein [Sideroxyarcus sp.]|nr:GspMb/PilO family protein [Sideroxyarcus sp.]